MISMLNLLNLNFCECFNFVVQKPISGRLQQQQLQKINHYYCYGFHFHTDANAIIVSLLARYSFKFIVRVPSFFVDIHIDGS